MVIFTGYEIKSDLDTLDRLPNQAELFSKVFDTLTLVCTPKWLDDAPKIIPDWWGIIQAKPTKTGNIRFSIYRKKTRGRWYCLDLNCQDVPTVPSSCDYTKSFEEAKKDTLPGGWQLVNAEENGSMKIGVYVRTVGGQTEYTLVNRGTQDWAWSADGDDNVKQLFGASKDVQNSIAYSKDFVKDHSGSNITFVGHSKGGAEAAANAVETNKNAILFNPAAVNLDAYTPNGPNYSASMTAHIVDGEILHSAEGWFSKPIGSVEYLPAQYPTNTWNPVTNGENAVKNHSMDAVIDGIKEKGGEN